MLDLEAAVDLDEVRLALGAEQKLEDPQRPRSRPRRAQATDSSSSSRVSGASAGEGDSSISFWCRRWIEHSRSPSVSTLPVESRQSTWISTWRAGAMTFSRYSEPS